MTQYEPNPPHTEAKLFYVDPHTLQLLAEGATLTWAEIMNDEKLGNAEFTLFIKLSEPADLSMVEVLVCYLHFWEGKSDYDLAEMYDITRHQIDEILTNAKAKLYPHLKHLIKPKLA